MKTPGGSHFWWCQTHLSWLKLLKFYIPPKKTNTFDGLSSRCPKKKSKNSLPDDFHLPNPSKRTSPGGPGAPLAPRCRKVRVFPRPPCRRPPRNRPPSPKGLAPKPGAPPGSWKDKKHGKTRAVLMETMGFGEIMGGFEGSTIVFDGKLRCFKGYHQLFSGKKWKVS